MSEQIAVPEPWLTPWNSDELEDLGRCPLCGSAERHLLHRELRDNTFGAAAGTWTMYACEGCRCAYLDPRPSIGSIQLAYKTYYTHDEREVKSAKRLGWTEQFDQLVHRQYWSWRFGANRARWLYPLGMRVSRGSRLQAILDSELRHLPRAGRGCRLLDVGCGSGLFMTKARAVGWTCEGTEVDKVAAQRVRERGFVVHEVDLAELAEAGQVYDALTVSHVIEHVHDPVSLLRAAVRLLKPGGYFWIETPNIGSHGHDCFGRDWRGLEPPRHLQIFTPQRLMSSLVEAGFVDVETAPWHPDWAITLPESLRLAGRDDVMSPEQMAVAEQVGRADPAKREFVTLRAHLPCPQ